MQDFKRQNVYLCGIIKVNPIVQRRPRNTENSRPPKSKLVSCFVPNEKRSVEMCNEFFLNRISDGRM